MHHCAAMENRMWLLQAPAGREAQGLTLLSFRLGCQRGQTEAQSLQLAHGFIQLGSPEQSSASSSFGH